MLHFLCGCPLKCEPLEARDCSLPFRIPSLYLGHFVRHVLSPHQAIPHPTLGKLSSLSGASFPYCGLHPPIFKIQLKLPSSRKLSWLSALSWCSVSFSPHLMRWFRVTCLCPTLACTVPEGRDHVLFSLSFPQCQAHPSPPGLFMNVS